MCMKTYKKYILKFCVCSIPTFSHIIGISRHIDLFIEIVNYYYWQNSAQVKLRNDGTRWSNTAGRWHRYQWIQNPPAGILWSLRLWWLSYRSWLPNMDNRPLWEVRRKFSTGQHAWKWCLYNKNRFKPNHLQWKILL